MPNYPNQMKNLLLILSLLGSLSAFAQNQALENTRPNIILIMTDDQGMGDFSCFGNPYLRTPNLDRFREKSTRFTDFQVSPSCSPTRAALLSGRHEFRNGVTHTILERDRMALSTTTVADLLRNAGYDCGIFGKWHLGDEDAYQPYHRGFNEVFIHGAGGIGQSFRGSLADFPPNQVKETCYFDNVLLHNDTIVQTKGYCTDVFFHAALGWIKQQNEAGTPYFAYLAPNAPHGPMIAPEKNFNHFLEMGFDEATAGRYGMIENLDENMGLFVEKMDEWQAWDNTLVIFMTDNGQGSSSGRDNGMTLNGEKLPLFLAGFKSGKLSPYEGGTHVPAFWRWKGVLPEGVDIPALTAHIDILPTFCDLAGVEIPGDIQELDGRSMLPLLKDPEAEWPDRELFFHCGRWGKGKDPNTGKYTNFAVRTQRWRWVNETELYDIANDPFESTNVIDEHPEVVARLRKAYEIWWEETLPFMVNEDVPLAAEQPQVIRYRKQLEEKGIPNWVPPEI